MGYGGAAKKIARVAVPIAVGAMTMGNPVAIALASAATTAATGGDFKEVAIAGATSYIGAEIGGQLAGDLTQAGDIAQASALSNVGMDSFAPGAVAPSSTFVDVLSNVPGIEVMGSTVGDQLASTPLGEGTDLPVSAFPDDPSALEGVGSLPTVQPPVGTPPADWINTTLPGQASVALDPTLAGIVSTPSQLGTRGYQNVMDSTIGELTGQAAGGAAGMHLNMSVSMALAEYPEVLIESGLYTPEEVAMLTEEKRLFELQNIGTELAGTVPRDPGFDPADFESTIRSGLSRMEAERFPQGGDVPESEFAALFRQPETGTSAIRSGLEGTIEETFPQLTAGESPFQPLSAEAVESIITPQREQAQKYAATRTARGDLSAMGGRQAGQFLGEQESKARSAVETAGRDILSDYETGLRGLRDEPLAAARTYTPGEDPLPFDRDVLGQERGRFVTERTEALPSAVSERVGTNLFDPQRAVQRAGVTQGLVSGASPQQPMLDVLASRRRGGQSRRGLGTGGVF
jgi:hypothetical protein